jgi:hypothetical protein
VKTSYLNFNYISGILNLTRAALPSTFPDPQGLLNNTLKASTFMS